MAANVEIKARIHNYQAVETLACQLADGAGQHLLQEDIFFTVPQGRLKLRILTENGQTRGELIYYERPNQAGPKESFYLISRTQEPETLKNVLSQALGQRGRVIKQRTVYLVGQTRIHLDQVEGLGEFLELEVVLSPGQTNSEGTIIAEDLMRKLGIVPSDLVEVAYVDLLNTKLSG